MHVAADLKDDGFFSTSALSLQWLKFLTLLSIWSQKKKKFIHVALHYLSSIAWSLSGTVFIHAKAFQLLPAIFPSGKVLQEVRMYDDCSSLGHMFDILAADTRAYKRSNASHTVQTSLVQVWWWKCLSCCVGAVELERILNVFVIHWDRSNCLSVTNGRIIRNPGLIGDV